MNIATRRLRRSVSRVWRYWLRPWLPAGRLAGAAPAYARYIQDWRRYARLPGAEPLRLENSYPCIFDASPRTPFDAHYLYQAAWAAGRILAGGARQHVDIGSDLRFTAQLAASGGVAALQQVIFVDIRPPVLGISRLDCLAGDLLRLPFAEGSIGSLSSLHVVEHIGLGRYGDALTPDGARLAFAALQQVLAPGGSLYLSLPVGRPRTEFNAHRIHAPAQVLGYFSEIALIEFSAVGDDGRFHPSADPADFAHQDYACGMFHFVKPGGS